MLRLTVFLGLLALGVAQCPNQGLSAHGRCWYLGDIGATCKATCSAQGLDFSLHVADGANPMTPQLLGRQPSTKQHAWGRLECYVPGDDRYHTAQTVAASNAGEPGDAGDWGVSVCRKSCPCAQPAQGSSPAYPQGGYPACVKDNTVLRHAGAHAIFVDVSAYGAVGCWQNDCKNSDKFDAEDPGVCARACGDIADCTHWAYGEQDGAKKCFLRKSDNGHESADGFKAGQRTCAPAELNPAFIAKAASQVLGPCDGGKSDACPDMARAITTWRYAINNLKKAAIGKLDGNMVQYLDQIGTDTDAFAAQMSEENFPVVVGNNRQVFNALEGWMASQPAPAINPNDLSLPNVLRGKLCGPNACFEKV